MFEDRVDAEARRCADAIVAAGIMAPEDAALLAASYVYFLHSVMEEAHREQQRSGLVGEEAGPGCPATATTSTELQPAG